MSIEIINPLENNIGNLRSNDRAFAESLIAGFRKYGNLTARQFPHAERLRDKAVHGYPTRDAAPTTNVGDMGGVYTLMQTAAANLKWPKIRLQDEDGTPVVLSISGPKSKAPGQINVTDGGPFGSNRWFGRVDGQGNWTRGRDAGVSTEALLRRLGDSPADVAANHGKLTGRCCFCNRALDDERSTSHGYGPVCAKNFGLPWGSK